MEDSTWPNKPSRLSGWRVGVAVVNTSTKECAVDFEEFKIATK
jgi:hypothetical protein